MFRNNRGFTLIELLVVIAIIGILASVVLASLNSARSKGADASTKSNLNNARAQAELFFDTGNTYVNVCLAATANGINPMLVGAQSSSGATSINTSTTAGTATSVVCHSSATGWVAAAPLKSETGYWCVDGNGTSAKRTSVVAASAVTCPAS